MTMTKKIDGLGARQLRERLVEWGLCMPYIPAGLSATLTAMGKGCFATRSIEMSPYNIDHYVAEWSERPPMDYAIVAHAGHGLNSWALHYYLSMGPLTLLLQLGWGGLYTDGDTEAKEIATAFELAGHIIEHIENRDTAGRKQILIAASNLGGCHLYAGSGRSRRPAFINLGSGPLDVLSKFLRQLRDEDK